MSVTPSACPSCGSSEIHQRKSRGDWICDQCEHAWRPADEAPTIPAAATKTRLFLSYGRDSDGMALADRLCVDLAAHGFAVWRDTREIVAGQSWQHEIADGLRNAQVVVYLMTPHSTRVSTNRESRDQVDSVCLGEIAYALFHPPTRPVVPVLAAPGAEPPLAIYHLDYVNLQSWKQSAEQYQAGLRRLLDGLAAALRGEKRYRKWHHQLNPWDFATLLNEKRAGFCGREWLFDAIDAWRSGQQERALLITGDPGVGKSALVAQLVFRNPAGQVLAYHCCQADTPETLRPARFVRSVAAMLAGQLPEYAARMDDPTVCRPCAALRADLDRPMVIGGALARVGVHGMGGIGKSVLAAALARDRQVREAFPDGIVWIGLGSSPDVVALQRRVHGDLGRDGAFETEHQGKARLKELLADKAVLLILDDAWRCHDVDCFDALSSRCRALVTTRDTGLLTALGGTHPVVELLTEREAQDVLALASGVLRECLPGEAVHIVAECGRLPLAVWAA